VTGDKTENSYSHFATKKQSMVCKHTGSPKPKKFKQTFHGRKLMATVLWDRKGVLLVAFMNPGSNHHIKSLL
jgi:hypothetical protein